MQILVIILFLTLAGAQYVSEGPCPEDRPVTKNFDIKRFTDIKWYKIYTYQHGFEPGTKCGFYPMKAINESSFEAENCNRFNGTKNCFLTRVTFLNQQKSHHDGHFLGEFLDGRHKDIQLGIITDYDNYGIGYSCDNVNDGEASEELLWVVSKDPKPTPEVKAEIKKRLDKYFEKNAIKKYINDEDFNCDFESEHFTES